METDNKFNALLRSKLKARIPGVEMLEPGTANGKGMPLNFTPVSKLDLTGRMTLDEAKRRIAADTEDQVNQLVDFIARYSLAQLSEMPDAPVN